MPATSRTPPAPRPVPKRTLPPPRRRRRSLLAVAAAGVVLPLAAILGALVLIGADGAGGDVARELRAAGCSLRTVPARAGRRHLTSLDVAVRYNSFPPTNGPHYYQWAIWGIYRWPVSQLRLVHNLEHGGVVIQYGDAVPDATVTDLVEFYARDPEGMLVAPFPSLGRRIALTAWTARTGSPGEGRFGAGHVGLCGRFDDDAFAAFRDAYRHRGPESKLFRPGSLAPGT